MVFGTPNTKNRASWGVLNVLKFWNMLQYRSIFGTVRTTMLKNKIIFYSISLSSFMTLSSLSFFSSFFPRLTSSSQFTSFPFISSSFFLQNLHLSLFLSFFLFPLFSFLSLSLCAFAFSIFFFFFPCHSPSLSFFFLHLGRCHWDRPPLWSSASSGSSTSPMRPLLWRSLILISLCFFFSTIVDSMWLWLWAVLCMMGFCWRFWVFFFFPLLLIFLFRMKE